MRHSESEPPLSGSKVTRQKSQVKYRVESRGLHLSSRVHAHIRMESHANRNTTKLNAAEQSDRLDPAEFTTMHERILSDRHRQKYQMNAPEFPDALASCANPTAGGSA